MTVYLKHWVIYARMILFFQFEWIEMLNFYYFYKEGFSKKFLIFFEKPSFYYLIVQNSSSFLNMR